MKKIFSIVIFFSITTITHTKMSGLVVARKAAIICYAFAAGSHYNKTTPSTDASRHYLGKAEQFVAFTFEQAHTLKTTLQEVSSQIINNMKEHTHPDYQDDLENVSEQDASTTAAIDTTELLPTPESTTTNTLEKVDSSD